MMSEKYGIMITEHSVKILECCWFETYYQPPEPNRDKITNEKKYSAESFDDHFVLTEKPNSIIDNEAQITIFGVAHDKVEAETRLYERAKNGAEWMKRRMRGHQFDPPINDETSRAKESELVDQVS